MTDEISPALREMEAALGAFARGPAQAAADSVAEAFERAGGRIAKALGGAVFEGEAGFRRLAQVAIEELAKIALQQIGASRAAPNFFGARAGGGSVTAGGAYLVGETGPEWFTPASAGRVTPAASAGGAVTVHFHLAGGASGEDLRRHHAQIAAGVARAAAYGRRNL